MKKLSAFMMALALAGNGAAAPWGKDPKEAAKAREAAVTHAKEILSVRRALLEHAQSKAQGLKLEESPGRVVLLCPPGAFFAARGDDMAGWGEELLNTVNDFASTFPVLYVTVLYERAAGTSEDDVKLGQRRATLLGAHLIRQGGLSPNNLYLRAKTAGAERFQLVFDTVKPSSPSGDRDIQGVLVKIKNPLLDFGKYPILSMDLALLDPGRVRGWSLRILNTASGQAVKEFTGSSDLWVSLVWDGKDRRGRPAPAGEYQAFLTATTLGSAKLSDSVGFVVKRAAAAARPRPDVRPETRPAPTEPPEAPEAPAVRRWAHVIHFGGGQSDVAGAGSLDVRQLAGNLKAFPDEKVVVEGFADADEKDARALAIARARAVVEALVSRHDIPRDRLSPRAKEPRRALEGENLQKAVAFFLEN